MPNVRAVVRAVGGWRLSAVLAGGLLVAVSWMLWTTQQRTADMRAEIRWLERRLADRRAMVARQREEMATVAFAVDRLTHGIDAMRTQEAAARRLAHMEESREFTGDIIPVRATVEGGSALVSEDAAHALAQLAWLEGQTADAGDSLAVLTVL